MRIIEHKKDMVEDNTKLRELADKLLETYELSRLLEDNDLTELDVILLLLELGFIDTELPVVVY